jgi:hypothetical protein
MDFSVDSGENHDCSGCEKNGSKGMEKALTTVFTCFAAEDFRAMGNYDRRS